MKADFYVGVGQDAEWIGSVSNFGEIYQIPIEIFIQVNNIMYEEKVFEFIKLCNGIIGQHPCKWPWPWEDSRMTDYSYFFIPEHEKVYASIEGNELIDPIKILQGYSLLEASTGLGVPEFPNMKKIINKGE